jgi:preprotein translocase subunit Sec61beta
MSRRRREAPMPATSAGLLRFFEEEGKGLKLRPEVVLIAGIALIVGVVVLSKFFPI